MFLETCKNLNRQHHCIVECIPVPKEIGDLAPIYFKVFALFCSVISALMVVVKRDAQLLATVIF